MDRAEGEESRVGENDGGRRKGGRLNGRGKRIEWDKENGEKDEG